MFCEQCGNELRDGASFCSKCGSSVQEKTPTEENIKNVPVRTVEPVKGEEPAVKNQPPKKSKKGLIIGLVAVLVLAAGIGAFGMIMKNGLNDKTESADADIDVEVDEEEADVDAENDEYTDDDTANENPAEDVMAESVQPDLNQYEDDLVINFESELLEENVREQIGKSEGDITYAEIKYLTDVNLDGADENNIENCVNDLKYFSSLSFLTIKTSSSSMECFTCLSELSYIKELCLDLRVNPDNLDFLSQLTGLENLIIKGNNVDGEPGVTISTGDLKNLSKLKRLSMSWICLENSDFFSGAKALEDIIIAHCDLVNYDFAKELENLQMLSLDLEDTNVDLSPIGKSESITILSVNFEEGDAYDYSFIREMEQLEGVFLENINDSSCLVNCSNLRMLKVEMLEGFDASIIGTMENMEILDLFGNCELPSFDKMQNLATLQIFDNDYLTDISLFKDLPKLEYLGITRCNGFSDISGLKDFSALRYLDLSDCDGVDPDEAAAMEELIETR